MVSEKLIAFILKARQNKRNDDQILQQLLSVGWKQEAITDAFSEIKSQKIVATAPAKPSPAPSQGAQTSPPWVKPAAAPAQAAQPAVQPIPPATAPQQPAIVSSSPLQTSSAPSEAAQTTQSQSSTVPPIAPEQQAPAVQMPSVIPAPQPAQQSPIPPANQIQLPPQKKSLFSSLFGKKAPPASPPPQASAQSQQPTAKLPVFPPSVSAQPKPQPANVPSRPSMQGQSTLATFAGASAPQNASGTAPVGPSSQPAQQPFPAAPQVSQSPQQINLNQAKPAGGIMKLLPIIVFVLILAAAGAYYVFVMMPSAGAPPPSQPIAPPGVNATPSNPALQAAMPIDCGADMDCFIQASGSCQAAKVTRNLTTDLFGLQVSGTTYMEIKNASEAGKCSLFSQTLDSSVKLSDALVAAALAKGVTQDDINKQEAESTKQAQTSVGLNGTCKYGASELSALLIKWKSGHFASSDYAGASCSGKMFESLNSNGGFSANLTLKNITYGKTNTTVKTNTSAKTNSTGSIKTNATTIAPKANATSPKANSTAPKANATTANSTGQANVSSIASSFKYSTRYPTYFPEHLAWFCGDRGTEFYRMHWTEYFGGECSSPKPVEGYVNMSEYTATGCTGLPCCINGPYNEYSRSYDYFECGFN